LIGNDSDGKPIVITKKKARKIANAKARIVASKPRRHDGDIVIPECAMMIPSAKLGEGSIDMLCWPAYEDCPIPPALHSVINEQVSIELKRKNVTPNGEEAKVHYLDTILEVPVQDVVLSSNSTRTVSLKSSSG